MCRWERHPGVFTLETSRGGGGVLSALASLLLLGKRGLRVLLGHLVEMSELLREHLEGHRMTTVLNGETFGTVSLFRVYPDGVDTWTTGPGPLAAGAHADTLLQDRQSERRSILCLKERSPSI